MFRPVAQIPLDYSVFKDKNSVFAWAPSGAILFGNGCVARTGQELKRLGVSRVVVVSDQGLVKAGIVQKVLDALEQAGVTYQLYDQCEADPSVETVEAIAALAKDADLLVGVGGGSSIDPAKAAAILVTNGGSIRDYQGCDKFSKAPLPLVAIPTAAGTGTETTPFAVITDRQRAWKMPIGGTGIMPALVIADPELTYSLPPHITAATGMDALTHAIEAYVSTLHGPFTDPLALQAIEMVLDYLPASYHGNMDAREQMHYAQCLAGMAFSNALLGIVHSMAHKTGAAFSTGHITHGCANAMYLPYVIRYNAKDATAASRYADIARRMGLAGVSEAALINSLCAKIDEMNTELAIPKTLQEFGIKEDEFKEKIASISELAVGDACTGSNPRAITPAEMERLFNCIYYGTEVDF